MKLYIEQIPAYVRPILAGDHTIWPRPEAVTLQQRWLVVESEARRKSDLN